MQIDSVFMFTLRIVLALIQISLPHEPGAQVPQEVNYSARGLKAVPIEYIVDGVQPIRVCPTAVEKLTVTVTEKRRKAFFYLHDESGGSHRWVLPEKWGLHEDHHRRWTMTPEKPEWHTNALSGSLGVRDQYDRARLDYCYDDYTFTLRKPNGERCVYRCFDRKSEKLKLGIAKGKNDDTLHEEFLLTDVDLTNGNHLKYEYDEGCLSSIKALNADKTETIGWAEIVQDLSGEIHISGSDGSRTVCRASPIDYLYDVDDRVSSINGVQLNYSSVSNQSEKDGVGIRYKYDDQGRILKISGSSLEDRFAYSNNRLTEKSLFNSNSCLYTRDFFYNDRGDVETECLSGDLTGSGRSTDHSISYEYDCDHLPWTIRDGDQDTYYSYLPGTDLLTSQRRDFCDETFEYDANRAVQTYHYSDAGIASTICVEPRREWPGYGLPEAITTYSSDESQVHRTHLTYDCHGEVSHKQVYDANDEPYWSERWERDNDGRVIAHHGVNDVFYQYDGQGRCTQENYSCGLTISQIYDDEGRVVAQTANGCTQHYAYDPTTGHLISITDFLGRETLIKDYGRGCLTSENIGYDPDTGRLTSIVDENGEAIRKPRYLEGRIDSSETQPEHYAYGHITSTISPPIRTQFGWKLPTVIHVSDPLGNTLSRTNEMGETTTYRYTALGQPCETTYPDGTSESRLYNTAGHLVEDRARSGALTKYELDSEGRPLATRLTVDGQMLLEETDSYLGSLHLSHTDGAGVETLFECDAQGRLFRTTEGGAVSEIEYNSIGLKRSETCSSGHFMVWDYDDHGRISSKTSETGTAHFAYDRAGNLTLQLSDGSSIETEFDSFGRPTQVTDSSGTTTVVYDDLYLFEEHPCVRTRMTDPHGISTLHICDGDGRLLREERRDLFDRLLQERELFYDLMGRVRSDVHTVHTPDGPSHTYTNSYVYGTGDRLLEHTQSGQAQQSTTTYSYDELGRLTTISSPGDQTVHRDYNDLGQVARFYGDGFDYRFNYDELGRVARVTSPCGDLSRSYTPEGLLQAETFPSKNTVSYEYDAAGRIATLVLPDGSQVDYERDGPHLQLARRTTTEGTSYEHRFLSRDTRGRPLEEELPVSAGHRTRRYDTGGLSSIQHAHYSDYRDTHDYDDLHHLTTDSGHEYSYDSLHNPLEKDGVPITTDGLNRITSIGPDIYEYDLAGNLSEDPSNRYSYDALGRLTHLETPEYIETYTYDPFDRRLSMKRASCGGDALFEEEYLYVGMMELGALTDGEITALRVLNLDMRSDIGATLAIELDGVAHVPLHDLRGSITTLLLDGVPVETYTFTHYGEETSSRSRNPYRFQSKRTDDTGLVLFGHRYYAPAMGRFLTPDPAHDGANLYAYMRSDPTTGVDHFGLWWDDNELPSTPYDDFLSELSTVRVELVPVERDPPRNDSSTNSGSTMPNDRPIFEKDCDLDINRPLPVHENPFYDTPRMPSPKETPHRWPEPKPFGQVPPAIGSRTIDHSAKPTLSNTCVEAFRNYRELNDYFSDFIHGMTQADLAFVGGALGGIDNHVLSRGSYFGRRAVLTIAPQIDFAIRHWSELSSHEKIHLLSRGAAQAAGFGTSLALNLGIALASVTPGAQPAAAAGVAAKGGAHAYAKAMSMGLPPVLGPKNAAIGKVVDKGALYRTNRFNSAAAGLSESGKQNIRILRNWAKSKGYVKRPNPLGRPEVWGLNEASEFSVKLKIKPVPSMRHGLAEGSVQARFEARLPLETESGIYVNPFTGDIGPHRTHSHFSLVSPYVRGE